jgi:hypothetical protein
MMMPEIAPRTKRIVFVERNGLHRICGTDAELPALPATVENAVIAGRPVPFANLYRVTRNACFYREPVTMASTFHAAQK